MYICILCCILHNTCSQIHPFSCTPLPSPAQAQTQQSLYESFSLSFTTMRFVFSLWGRHHSWENVGKPRLSGRPWEQESQAPEFQADLCQWFTALPYAGLSAMNYYWKTKQKIWFYFSWPASLWGLEELAHLHEGLLHTQACADAPGLTPQWWWGLFVRIPSTPSCCKITFFIFNSLQHHITLVSVLLPVLWAYFVQLLCSFSTSDRWWQLLLRPDCSGYSIYNPNLGIFPIQEPCFSYLPSEPAKLTSKMLLLRACFQAVPWWFTVLWLHSDTQEAVGVLGYDLLRGAACPCWTSLLSATVVPLTPLAPVLSKNITYF